MPRKKSTQGQGLKSPVEYVRGSGQPGWDSKVGKWRGSDGRIATQAKAFEELADTSRYGSFVQFMELRPVSKATERLESIIAGIPVEEAIKGVTPYEWWFQNSQKAQPIPTDVLARMKLAEHYYGLEGDVAALVDLPIDFGLQQVEVTCPDTGVQNALRQFYGAEVGIDLDNILYQLSICERVYGQAFPLEVWLRKGIPDLEEEVHAITDEPDSEGRTHNPKNDAHINRLAAAVDDMQDIEKFPFDSTLPAVVPLNPKNMYVGQMVTYGAGDYAMTPSDVEQWSIDQLIKKIPKLMYVSLARRFNEQVPMGRVPLNPEYCQPIWSKKQSWERYAYPQMSKALRPLSTRQILEELIRGTLEGYKSPLWLFLLGSETQPPSPQEIKAFKATLDGQSGERTSYLIWRMPLKVEVLTPKGLDEVSGNELYQQLTRHIFRQMNITPRLVGDSGERGMSREFELDIDLYIERVNRLIRNLMAWERHFRMNWAKWDGSRAAQKSATKAIVRCGEINFTRKMRIRDELMPYIQAGLLSDHTSLEKAGYNYDVELARKEEEEPNRQLFGPKPTYAQTTVSPTTPEKEAQTSPQGRPAEGMRNSDSRKAQSPEDEEDEEEVRSSVVWESISL